MENMIFSLLIFTILIGGVVWLQIFLSKKNNKWLGLILPIVSFLYSIMIVFSLTAYQSYMTTTETVEEDGVIISEETRQLESEEPGALSIIGTVLPVFLMSNIPTVLLVAIYYASRERMKVRNQLDKMNIQDLE